eukprot:gene2679-biopygen15619
MRRGRGFGAMGVAGGEGGCERRRRRDRWRRGRSGSVGGSVRIHVQCARIARALCVRTSLRYTFTPFRLPSVHSVAIYLHSSSFLQAIPLLVYLLHTPAPLLQADLTPRPLGQGPAGICRTGSSLLLLLLSAVPPRSLLLLRASALWLPESNAREAQRDPGPFACIPFSLEARTAPKEPCIRRFCVPFSSAVSQSFPAPEVPGSFGVVAVDSPFVGASLYVFPRLICAGGTFGKCCYISLWVAFFCEVGLRYPTRCP